MQIDRVWCACFLLQLAWLTVPVLYSVAWGCANLSHILMTVTNKIFMNVWLCMQMAPHSAHVLAQAHPTSSTSWWDTSWHKTLRHVTYTVLYQGHIELPLVAQSEIAYITAELNMHTHTLTYAHNTHTHSLTHTSIRTLRGETTTRRQPGLLQVRSHRAFLSFSPAAV